MTGTNRAALDTANAYYDAWTSGNVDKAMSYLAEDIVCDAPAGQINGLDAYRKFTADFVSQLTGATPVAAFGDDHSALSMYEVHTVPVKSSLVTELATVENGKITQLRMVFDQAPFMALGKAN